MLQLNNGNNIPQLGFGTFKLKGDECVNSIKFALNYYTHIDTANIYKNTTEIGLALKETGIDRSKLFITSKIDPYNMTKEKSRNVINKNLEELQIDYLDLMLIHFPAPAKTKHNSIKCIKARLETQNVICEFYSKGKVKNVGVSNQEERHIEELIQLANKNQEYFKSSQLNQDFQSLEDGKESKYKDLQDSLTQLNQIVKPQINQFELHPFQINEGLIKQCNNNNIVVQAQSILNGGNQILIENEMIKEIGYKQKKSCAQVCIKWGIQRGFCVLVKSKTESRIMENTEINDFILDLDEINKINKLSGDKPQFWNAKDVI